MRFGDRMRAHRVRMGLTQEQVGEYLGKTKNNISQYELGKREPDLSALVKLARLFTTTTDELLGCERPPEADTGAWTNERSR